MKAKLIIEGKEHDIELSDEKMIELINPNTGYERVCYDGVYYVDNKFGVVESDTESKSIKDDGAYGIANYYSNETIAKNNARADNLMRQLRRFAAQHNGLRFDWREPEEIKYCIYYNNQTGEFEVAEHHIRKGFGQIYFDSQEIAYDAINAFKNELLWYFTDYRDRL